MFKQIKQLILKTLQVRIQALSTGWKLLREKGPSQIQFWLIALVIGIVSGAAALGFRKGIEWLQASLYGTDDLAHLHSFASTLPWYWILVLPAVGGLVVGIILNWFTPDGRVRSVADVIEGAALWEGRVEKRAGIGSALASFITLSTGGSTGREGPVVHIAGVVSSWIANRIKLMGSPGVICWGARWRQQCPPVSMHQLPGLCLRWRWYCAILLCMPLPPLPLPPWPER